MAWIGIRTERRAEPESVSSVEINEDTGLAGDHYNNKKGRRKVTLIQHEHLVGMGQILGKNIDPGWTRRNIVVKGINLLSLHDAQFTIGKVVILKGTGYCHPCSRMEENLGPGGYNAMRGHGGITAEVICGGNIGIGDDVSLRQS